MQPPTEISVQVWKRKTRTTAHKAVKFNGGTIIYVLKAVEDGSNNSIVLLL